MIQRLRTGHYKLTLVVLMMGSSAYVVAQSIISPALATIQRELHTTQQTVTWLLTLYLLTGAVAIPMLGRIGDMYGKDRVFLITLLIFVAGSVTCALAPNIEVMIAGRGIQGIGGGVIPLGFGIIREEVPPEKRNAAIGMIAALIGVFGGLGTVLAGPVVDLLDYHWLFWLPAIFLALSAVAALFIIPASAVRAEGKLNWTGAALMSAWLVALLLGVSQAPTWGWTSIASLGLIALGIVLCLLWIAAEARANSPIIDMRMMRRPTVWRLNLVSLLYGVGQYGSFVFLPEYAQSPKSTGYGYGATVTQSGLYLLPSSVMTFLFGLASAPLSRRFGQKQVVLAGSSLAIVSYVILALPIHGVAVLAGASACQGAGFGLAFSTMANMLVTAVPLEQTGVANGMNTNLRTIGGAIGVAAASSVITAHLQSGGYPIASGYRNGWLVLAGCASVATIVALALPRDPRRARPRLVATASGGSHDSTGVRQSS